MPGHIHGLTQALARDGHDVVLLSTGSPSTSNESPIRLVRASVDLPWLPDDDVVARIASANNHLTALVHDIGSWRPDVVHAHGWETSWCATTLARIFDVPLVATFHSTERSNHGGFVPPGESTSVHSVESELQSQVDIEGVSDIVHLEGFVPDERLRHLLHSAGCVVIPSLYEPFGIVALESLAAGAPTIVARTGGLAEIMEGTAAGLMFEPGNALQLADHIHNVLTDADVARSLSHEGQVLLEERYTWQAVARGTLDVYTRSLGT